MKRFKYVPIKMFGVCIMLDWGKVYSWSDSLKVSNGKRIDEGQGYIYCWIGHREIKLTFGFSPLRYQIWIDKMNKNYNNMFCQEYNWKGTM